MSDEPIVFSRSYLQNIHTEHKKNEINNMIAGVIHHIRNASSSGQTSYFVDMTDYSNRQNPNRAFPPHHYPPPMSVYTPTIIPPDEIVNSFKEKFPDCTVTYQETPIEPSPEIPTDPNTAVTVEPPAYVGPTVKKGILIDWS